MPRKRVLKTVSIMPDMLDEAKKRAENLGLGFSMYVKLLIKKDLKDKKPLLVEPIDEDPPSKEELGKK